MTTTNTQMSQQLSVKIEDGQLKISIGIALLAFAIQSQDQWPEDWYVSDLAKFAKSMARQLRREEEDGTTPVHRMLDAAAGEVLEQGDDGVDEGNVKKGIKLAKSVLDGCASPSPQTKPSPTKDFANTQPLGDHQPLEHKGTEMRRDMELVRTIFKQVLEKKDLKPREITIEGYDEIIVGRHLEMLYEAGYLHGIVHSTIGRQHSVILVRDLTWEGHEFAGAILVDDSVWSKVKSAFGPDNLAIAPLKIVQAVATDALTAWAKARIGL